MQLVVNDTADISLFFEYAQGPQGLPGPKGDRGATGPKGLTGPSGDDAYEVAVSEGFVGTRAQWLASLVGPQGPQGETGPAGTTSWTGITDKPTTLLGYGITDAADAAPVQSVVGKTGDVTLNKADVGLGNVDNTSDLDKPISTATQTALDAKADAAVVGDIAAALTAINGV